MLLLVTSCFTGIISRVTCRKLERRSRCWKAVATCGNSVFKVFKNDKICKVAGFCICNQKNVPGWTSTEAPRCSDPATNFRLTRQRSQCSCFTKRPAAVLSINSFSHILQFRRFSAFKCWMHCNHHLLRHKAAKAYIQHLQYIRQNTCDKRKQ